MKPQPEGFQLFFGLFLLNNRKILAYPSFFTINLDDLDAFYVFSVPHVIVNLWRASPSGNLSHSCFLMQSQNAFGSGQVLFLSKRE